MDEWHELRCGIPIFGSCGRRWSKAFANSLPAIEIRAGNIRWPNFRDWRDCRGAAACPKTWDAPIGFTTFWTVEALSPVRFTDHRPQLKNFTAQREDSPREAISRRAYFTFRPCAGKEEPLAAAMSQAEAWGRSVAPRAIY